MSILSWFKSFFKAEVPSDPQPIAVSESAKKPGMRIDPTALAYIGDPESNKLTLEQVFALPTPPKGVVPDSAKMAMDSAFDVAQDYGLSSVFSEGLSFYGYQYLSQLSQRPEYRKPSEIIAKEMCRKWCKLICTGEEKKDDKLKVLETELVRLDVKELFQKAAEQDGFFGRSQIFMDLGDTDNEELKTKLAKSKAKIGNRSIKRLVVVEPTWTYPADYNSTDPLSPNFYKPTSWFVMGKQVHSSRFLTFISREVADILKPTYNFGGLSLTQILHPYVENWLRTRQSVSDLLYSFSINVLKTNMASILSGGAGEDVGTRVAVFNKYRDNKGCFVIDKDTEEFINVSSPLGTLDKLQAQAQEQMASVAGIPLIILLKITPSGLNASSDGEIRTFYDWIHAQQESLFTPLLRDLIEFIQLSLFGEIDPEISFKWQPLWTLDEQALANVRKTEADTDIELIDAGVIDNVEARTRLAQQEDSPYAGLDLSVVPEPSQESEEDLLGGLGELKAPGMDENKWITVHPNGPDNEGRPALIDGESGEVKGGMGGKFTGEKVTHTHEESSSKPEKKQSIEKESLKETPTKISEAQSDALTVYSGSKYEEINSSLRSGKLSAENKKIVDLIDSAMQGSKEKFDAIENQELFRAAGIPEIQQALQSGKSLEGIEFTDNGFVSTTKDQKVLGTFKREDANLFIFHVPKGTPMVDMSEHSQFGDKEGEVLLGRGMKYRVRNVEVRKEKTQFRGPGGKVGNKTIKQNYIHVDIIA